MKEEYQVTIHRHKDTGHVSYEGWQTSDHKFYCPTGPAIKCWAKNGEWIREEWTNKDGDHYRDGDQPAYLERDPKSGVIYLEKFYENGLLGRKDKDLPSIIGRDIETGKMIYQGFYLSDQIDRCHRDDQKPAVIQTCPKTDIDYFEAFWTNDKCLGVIERDKNTGAIIYKGPPTLKHQGGYGIEIGEEHSEHSSFIRHD
tara:strand:- start:938 stop:1534 length:597 start_codon:yes stop_codon:yes gene_type:complete